MRHTARRGTPAGRSCARSQSSLGRAFEQRPGRLEKVLAILGWQCYAARLTTIGAVKLDEGQPEPTSVPA